MPEPITLPNFESLPDRKPDPEEEPEHTTVSDSSIEVDFPFLAISPMSPGLKIEAIFTTDNPDEE